MWTISKLQGFKRKWAISRNGVFKGHVEVNDDGEFSGTLDISQYDNTFKIVDNIKFLVFKAIADEELLGDKS